MRCCNLHAGIQICLDVGFGGGSHNGLHQFTFVEDEEGGNGADVVASGKILVAAFFNIGFANFGAACHLGGELLDDGHQHFARTAPSRPEVDQHGNRRLENLCFKVAFCYLDCHNDV